MPTLTLNFRPKALDSNTDVNIILPDELSEDMPVLYLLHGMHGDHGSWTNGSAIGRYARTRGIVVVMPSAENSFYCNMKYGCRYYDYVAKELPEYLETLLPITKKREKTFIAGLSMGGYGAIKLALRDPDRYAAAAGLSGCLDIASTVQTRGWNGVAVCNWGENYKESVKGTEDDLMHLVDTFPEDKKKPRLYIACGTEDYLYQENIRFRDHIVGKGFEYSYNEGPGAHTWDFWDEWIAPAIDYMIAPILGAEA